MLGHPYNPHFYPRVFAENIKSFFHSLLDDLFSQSSSCACLIVSPDDGVLLLLLRNILRLLLRLLQVFAQHGRSHLNDDKNFLLITKWRLEHKVELTFRPVSRFEAVFTADTKLLWIMIRIRGSLLCQT